MASFEGTYLITELTRAENHVVDLPDSYRMTLAPTDTPDEYQLNVKFGNNMGGRFVVTNGNELDAGPLRSTMMMPPDAVYKVEIAFGTIVEKADKIGLKDNVLEILGSAGRVLASKVEV